MRLVLAAALAALAVGCGGPRGFRRPAEDTRELYARVGHDLARPAPEALPAGPASPTGIPCLVSVASAPLAGERPPEAARGRDGRGWDPYDSITFGRNAAREATYVPDDLSKTAILVRLVEEVPGIGAALRDTRVFLAEKGGEIVREVLGEETSLSLHHGDNPYELTRARATGVTVGVGRTIRGNEGRVDVHVPTAGSSVTTLYFEYSISFD